MKRAIKPFIALAVFSFAVTSIALATDHDYRSRESDDPNWSELIASMDKMLSNVSENIPASRDRARQQR
jgi:hypothetical protein